MAAWVCWRCGVAEKRRHLVGLHSGQAADGVDAALVEIRGRGPRMKVRQIRHAHVAYDPALRSRIAAMACDRSEPAGVFAELDHDVGLVFASAAKAVGPDADPSQRPPQPVDAIGSSGQVIRRLTAGRGRKQAAELVVGAPAVIAALNDLPVVHGFSASDLAAGGQGGSETAWPDWLLFVDKRLSRVAVHLGGVASLTFVPAGALAGDVVAFDVGPGTLLADALSQKLFNRPFDADGAIASRAKASGALLNELLADEYFHRPPPKSTGRWQWGQTAAWRMLNMGRKHQCEGPDLLATATEMTARSIAAAVAGLTERPHEVILSGGGAMNIHLAGRIRTLLCPCSTYAVERYGLGLRAHGAVCYAILAAARLDKVSAHCASASGAGRPAVLGSVVLP